VKNTEFDHKIGKKREKNVKNRIDMKIKLLESVAITNLVLMDLLYLAETSFIKTDR
jgi:hypothetical protein